MSAYLRMQRRCPGLLATMFFLCSLAWSQSELKTVLSSLEHKVVLLRQPAEGTVLAFDADGQLLKGKAGNQNVYGCLEITRARQKREKIVVEANRLLSVYNLEAKKFIQYRSGRVVIEVTPASTDVTAVHDVIGKIFVSEDPQRGHVVPDLDEKGKSPGKPGELRILSNGERVYRVGGEVKPPRTISAHDPEYSEAARQARFNGSLSLWAVIDERGAIKYLEVIKPAGYGLEANAIEAVSGWKFEPATLNGQPVPVQVTVEINFRM